MIQVASLLKISLSLILCLVFIESLSGQRVNNGYDWNQADNEPEYLALTQENIDSVLDLTNEKNITVLSALFGSKEITLVISLNGADYTIDSIDNRLFFDLLLNMNEVDKDWVSNLLLYQMTKRDATTVLSISSLDPYIWRLRQKDQDWYFWLSHPYFLNLPNE